MPLRSSVAPRGNRACGWHARRAVNGVVLSFIFGVGAVVRIQFRLALVGYDLLLQLRNLLARIRQRVSFAIEGLHPMTADATALVEKILAEIQRVRAQRHPIIRVTHLAPGFGVLFMK